MDSVFIILAVALTGGILLWPRLSSAPLWRASITPLASIIGSGFLVIGPILDASYGRFAPLVMAALCGTAYLFGSAIRFNIARLGDKAAPRSPFEEKLETLSAWALAFAYVISVAYYLNLLGAFSVSLTTLDDTFHARLVTSCVFALILFVGWTRGFAALERLEQISVGVKLAIIAGLLTGLGMYFAKETSHGGLVFVPPSLTGWPALTLAFGLIVTVQGFETSRYLSAEYNAATRVRSMQVAQWTSTAIYMIYIGLMAYLFTPDTLALDETAIIDLMQIVAPILPILLIIAAVAAQFSAAVADTSGSGGLLAELTRNRLSTRMGYALLVTVGLLLTWVSSVFDLISYASRAFAVYYGLQSFIAMRGAQIAGKHPFKIAVFAGLGTLAALIAVFGVSVE